MPDSAKPPAPPASPEYSRAALERVLARAAELQAESGGAGDEPALTEAQLIEIAGEVGLSRDVVRQALAEERARFEIDDDGSWAAELGLAMVDAVRTVPADAKSALAALDDWMQRTESLQLKRRFNGDQLVWEPRQDFFSAVRRALKLGGRPFSLATASEVHAIVTAVEASRTYVRIIARFDETRRARAIGAGIGALISAGVGVTAFLLAMNANSFLAAGLSVVPALVVPVLITSLTRSAFGRVLARARVSLEQALDRLEFGAAPRRGFL